MAPRHNSDSHETITLSVREWDTTMDVIHQLTRECQLNREDILVMKTKFGIAAVVSGLIGSAVSSIIVSILLFWLKIK